MCSVQADSIISSTSETSTGPAANGKVGGKLKKGELIRTYLHDLHRYYYNTVYTSCTIILWLNLRLHSVQKYSDAIVQDYLQSVKCVYILSIEVGDQHKNCIDFQDNDSIAHVNVS